MNNLRRPTTLALIAAVIALLVSADTASAQKSKRVHRLARIIEKHAHELHEEVDEHFKPSPAYKHLHRHVRDIERLAKAVHNIVDDDRSHRALRKAIQQLDVEIHHLVKVAEDSKQYRNIPPQAYLHLRREVRYLHEAVRDMMHELD
jgi:predicted phage-related endonuclease